MHFNHKIRFALEFREGIKLGEAVDLAGDEVAGEAEGGAIAEVNAILRDEVVGITGELIGELLNQQSDLPRRESWALLRIPLEDPHHAMVLGAVCILHSMNCKT